MAEIKSLLDGVIEQEIQNVEALSSGSDEKSKAIQNLATLHKLRIEEIKAETEAEEKRERRVMDSEQRKAELALKEKQATQQETQHQAELSIKERQVDSAEAERKMKDEQFKAELALKKRQADGDTAEHKLKEKQSETESQHKGAELVLKERELDSKDADRTQEGEIQKRQARDQMVDRCVRAGVAVGELVLPLVFYGIWMNKGFKFEETGSFTSTTFKNLLNRFRPTK